MNDNLVTRQNFADLLEKTIIPGNCTDEKRYLSPIAKIIMELLPKQLYRYRKVDEYSLDALDKGMIFCSRAKDYNDPYDTLISANLAPLQEINSQFLLCIIKAMCAYLRQGGEIPENIKQLFPQEFLDECKTNAIKSNDAVGDEKQLVENLAGITNTLICKLNELAPLLRNASSFACFSESINSVTMWAHYADYHTGFALAYDFEALISEKPIEGVIISPVIYSDKRYDSSSLLAWAVGQCLAMPTKETDKLAHMKASLYKSKDWEYEKEWRLINLANTIASHPSIQYQPNAIYYGLHISNINKKILHRIAVEKGLKEYEMSIDNSLNKYELQIRSCNND